MRATLLFPVLLLAGCAAEPVPYHSGNEIPRGAGLLSGAEGAFVLRSGGNAAAPESAAPRNADEEREYREWREERRRQGKE